MKCKLISLLTVLILPTHISQGQNNITVSLDVEKIPELGFVISSQRSEMTSMEFSANGHAKYQLENTDAVYLTLHNGFSERKMIYAEQGDHIQLSFDGASMAKTLKMKGVRQSIADYLEKVNLAKLESQDYALELQAFSSLLKDKVISNQHLLDSCQNSLSKESSKFVKIESNRIKYTMALCLLDYPRHHSQITKNDYIPKEDYYEILAKWAEEDEDLLCLWEYRTFMTEIPAIIINDGKTDHTSYEKALQQMESINSYFKNERVKQSLLTIIANEYIKSKGILESKELDHFFRQHVKSKDLLAQYLSIYDSWATVAPGQLAPEFKATDPSGKEHSLKDFRGQYICLYLWPNINPCIQEFSHLEKLRPLFKKKNITLVNLSIDKNEKAWQEIIQNKELQVGIHLYSGFDRELLRRYHYNPGHMFQFTLIDPNGKIIELHAPAPSSGMENFIQTTTW